jgi:hypothetical protein
MTKEGVAGILEFGRHRLPQLNRACRDGYLPLASWITEAAAVAAAAHEVLPAASAEGRAQIRFVMGMTALSAERHAQPVHAPGEVYALIPLLPEILTQATAPGHRPALNHHDYWITNLGTAQLTFTGEEHELFFISSVQTQSWLRTVANHALRPILAGHVDIESTQAIRLLECSASALEQGRLQYHDFKTSPMNPKRFNEMRVWLPCTVIASTTYKGPNAAYIAEMATTDSLLGTADDHYHEYVSDFMVQVEPQERVLLDTDMHTPSLTQVLGAALGLRDETGLAQASAEQVARLLAANPVLHAAATAARSAHRAFCGASGVHFGHINTHLVKFGESLSDEQRAAMPVDPAAGVGGNTHEHTRTLHNTRRKTPAWLKLNAALAQLEGPTEPARQHHESHRDEAA